MEIKFNKDKFFKLLKERYNFQKEGNFLRDFDKAKNDELTEYLIFLQDQIFWENRNNYFEMSSLYIRKNISLDEFCDQFYTLRLSNLKLSRMWEDSFEKEACHILTRANKIDLKLNSKSVDFTDIISSLYWWADLCDPEITFEMDLKYPELMGYGISEKSFRLIIEKDFFPNQNYFIFHLQH